MKELAKIDAEIEKVHKTEQPELRAKSPRTCSKSIKTPGDWQAKQAPQQVGQPRC
jgi:hypothetical protein